VFTEKIVGICDEWILVQSISYMVIVKSEFKDHAPLLIHHHCIVPKIPIDTSISSNIAVDFDISN
jgi:hypothetical protein